MNKRLRMILAALAFLLAGIATLQSIPGRDGSPSLTSPPVIPTGTPEAESTGLSSEHYRIVDDSTEGYASDLGAFGATPVVETNARVTRVKDGDTFVAVLDDGAEVTVRLLGVDTPETVDPRKEVQCFGKNASDFTTAQLTDKRVLLTEDPQADERDRYGRLLRNLTLEDGTDFNAALIGEGYAYAYLSFPLDPARKNQLRDLEAEAKAAGRGLWAEGACDLPSG